MVITGGGFICKEMIYYLNITHIWRMTLDKVLFKVLQFLFTLHTSLMINFGNIFANIPQGCPDATIPVPNKEQSHIAELFD